MKYAYKKLIFLTLSLFIIIFSLVLFLSDKQEFSSNENRVLTSEINFSFERLIDGSFIKNVENYLTDQFPLREKFLSLHTTTERFLGKKAINDVYISKEEYLLEKYKKPKNNDKIINVLNSLNDNNNYINFNLMLVPTSIEINKDKLPNNAITASQKEEIDYIYKNINFDTINLYDVLKENNKDYDMFYRLDHHWTTYAAYYAFVEFAKQNNLSYSNLSRYEIEEVTTDFNGTLYSKSNYYKYKPDSIFKFSIGTQDITVDYVTTNKTTNTLYESKYLKEKDKYSYFLDNNHPIIKITNNKTKNGKEIIILKDSYANCFIPFLVNSYEVIHVIDPRFYKYPISDYLNENKNIKDGLILYNMQTIDSDTGILSIR